MTATNVSLEQIKAGMLTPGIYLSSAQFTFSIANAASVWSDDYAAGSEPFKTGYSVLNADQAAAFRLALSSWDRLIAPSFTEVTETASQYGEVRIAFTSMDSNTAGYAYQSSEKTPFSIAADVWLSSVTAAQSFAAGTGNFETLIHELGHVLGLKHPFEGTALPAGFDSQRYTVMSYTPIDAGVAYGFAKTLTGLTSVSTPVNATTPMVFDIAAVQALYGADQKTAAGNDTYRFEESSTVIQSLYDAGGVDTIDLSNFTRPVLLDLTPGAYSSLGFWSQAAQVAHWTTLYPNFTSFIQNFYNQRSTDESKTNDPFTWTDNLGIAFSTVIENAVGGAGNDVLVGNAAANSLSGGGGADSIAPGGGRNSANGGAGSDILVLSAARSDYKIFSVNGFDFLIGTSDQHKVTGFEQATFANGSVSWAELKSGAVAFDPSAYLAANADLLAFFGTNTAAAADHYVRYGFAEGRPTGPTSGSFDALSYLAANADLSRHFGLNLPAATEHYQTYGIKEGRPTSGFDALRYLASNADLSKHFGLDPEAGTKHFVQYGAKEGRPTTSFDALLYLASNADLSRHFGPDQAAGTKHFIEYGAKEGRATTGFDALLYLASNADLSRHFGVDLPAATKHFVQYGADEGRATTGFNAMRYIASNADLIKHFGPNTVAATDHFVRYGADEGRPTTSFDPMRYLDANPDLLAYFGRDAAAASDHYVRYGFKEGRPTGASAAATETDSVALAFAADDVSWDWLEEPAVAQAPVLDTHFQPSDEAALAPAETLDGALYAIAGSLDDLVAGSYGLNV